MGPLLIVGALALILGYTLIYVGASLGTSWETDFRQAFLGGLSFAGAKS